MKTVPLNTAGELTMSLPVDPLHRGEHVACPQPFALNAYRFPSNEPMYTTPLTTAAEEKSTRSPMSPCHAKTRNFALSLLMTFSNGLTPVRDGKFLNCAQLL